MTQALIRAIHGVDELSSELRSCPRGVHVKKVAAGASEASKRELCLTLPTAILLAAKKVSPLTRTLATLNPTRASSELKYLSVDLSVQCAQKK